jgi:hypothetical protein
MREEIRAFSCAKSAEQFAYSAAETRNGSLGGLAQKRLQFAESLLDRI